MTILSALVLLGILIFVHEVGHFMVAKALGVKVLKFSLGFGPKVLGRRYGETEYLISAFPLGGYVKMLGEDLEEELSEEEKMRSYNYQPVWKRAAIVFFGPLFNLLFACLVFFFIFTQGVPHLLPVIGEVMPGSPAERAGLQKGDRIVKIDGEAISRWDEMTAVIHGRPDMELVVSYERGGDVLSAHVSPERKTVKDVFGQDKEVGLIGITPAGDTGVREESLSGAVVVAFQKTWQVTVLTLMAIVKLIQRIIPADTIGGPILIFQMAGQQASQGAMSFFSFMAIISINLAVLNLLPIPILDGGHLLFLGIEAVRKKPLSERVVMVAQRIGLVLLLTLMAFAFYNDIVRLFTGTTFTQ